MRPQRLQPTRLPRPWDSPGKNTGVGCHFLLHCMKVKSESEVSQSCLTLSDPMDCSSPGSSIRGIFQARVLQWGAIKNGTRNQQSHSWAYLLLVFTIAKMWKQTKCPSTKEWIKICIYNGIILRHKKNKIMPFAATWMDLESTMPSEVSQTEKDKYHKISLLCEI